MPDAPRPSPRAVAGSLEAALPAEDAVERSPVLRWQRAYVLAAAGRYAAALTDLEALTAEGPGTASAAHRLRASIWRQLCLYGRAEHDSARALELASRVEDRTARGELHAAAAVGHVADAVGRLQTGQASAGALLDARLAVAVAAVASLRSGAGQRWRHDVRLGWVTGEVAITRGELGTADAAFARALADAEAAGAPRHAAKSRLFCAAVRAAQRDMGAAEGLAGDVIDAAVRVGAWPLVWPALLIRAEATDDPEEGQAARREAAHVLHEQIRDLPSAVRAEITASHPTAWLLRDYALLSGLSDG